MVYVTSLVTRQIGDSMDAAVEMNNVREDRRQQIKRVPMVFVPSRFACSMWCCVPQGFRALVASHGKFVEIWDAGYHTAPPWYSITHLIGEHHIVYDTPVKECPTLDNVMVTIDITLVLHINPEDETLQQFAFKLGPEGLDGMLQQIQQDSVRSMVRGKKYNQIYDLMNATHDEILKGTMRELNGSFRDYGVVITAMAVTNVHLPNSIAADMAQATIYHNQDEYHKLNQQYKLLVIDNEEKEKKEIQAMKEKLEQYEAECRKSLAEEFAKFEIIKAETKKILAVIREQENADVKKIGAESCLKEAEINAQRDEELARIKAGGEAEAENIRVETRAFVLKRMAEAEEQVANRQAEAITTESQAEDQAAQNLKSKRTYDQKMLQLQVLSKLASNRDVSISGNSQDNMVAQLLSSARGAAIMGVNRV